MIRWIKQILRCDRIAYMLVGVAWMKWRLDYYHSWRQALVDVLIIVGLLVLHAWPFKPQMVEVYQDEDFSVWCRKGSEWRIDFRQANDCEHKWRNYGRGTVCRDCGAEHDDPTGPMTNDGEVG